MDAHASRLFRAAAIVQAFPVIAGVVLSSLQLNALDLDYAPYGTFFAPFALFDLWTRLPERVTE